MRRVIAGLTVLLFAACGSESTTPTGNPAATVTISPATTQLSPQQTVQLTAAVKDADGAAILGKTITWTSSPSGLVTINGSGLVTAVAPGTATVTGSTDGKHGVATITIASATTVTATGGTVTAANGKVQLTFPAGAVSGNTAVTVAPMVNPPLNARTVSGTAYEFGPSGSFTKPVTVAIKYDPSAVPSGTDPKSLRLYTLTGGAWVLSPNSYADLATNTVVGDVKHFSGWITCAFPCAIDTPSFDIGTQYSYYTIKTGASLTAAARFWRHNYSGPINVTLEGAPSGLSLAVGAGQYPETPNFIFTATTSTPLGAYNIDVVGRGTGVAESRFTISMTVSAPGYAFTVTPSAVPVVQGATAAANIAITRDGYNGPITFSAINLPTGVTASFSPTPVTGNSTVMTLTALANAPIGNFNTVSVKGTAAGLPDNSLPGSVSVISSSGFSLVGTPPLASLSPGSSGFTGVKALRAPGFNGVITYSVTGLPAGLTAVVTATAVADSMKVTFTATGAVPVANYNVTVTGTSGGKSENAAILVTVGSPGTATVQLDLSKCVANGQTIWLAAQDGAGAFTVVNGSAGLYSFPITSGKGVYAAVLTGSGKSHTYVNYGTPAELPLMKICLDDDAGPVPSKVLHFSALGLAANDRADVSIGGNFISLQPALNTGDFTTVPEGPLDFVAWKYHLPSGDASIRGIIRRDQNIGSNGTIAPFDFASGEAFIAATASGTASAGTPSLGYYTGAGCSSFASLGYQLTPNGTMYGVPTSAQRPTDLHSWSTGTSNATGFQQAQVLFHTMASKSVSLGAAMPSPTTTTLTGPYRRLQVAFTLPGDFTHSRYEYFDGNTKVSLMGQTGYFGGQSMTLAMPDLSALPGYSIAFFPGASSHSNFNFRGQSHAWFPCTDGTTYKISALFGSN